MAAPDSEHKPAAAGGSGFSRRIGGAPAWVWAVGAGAVAGLVWFARRKASATQTAAQDQTGTTDGTVPTTIVPQYGGIAEAQYEQLLAAIRALQGAPSLDPGVPLSDLPQTSSNTGAAVPPTSHPGSGLGGPGHYFGHPYAIRTT